MGEFSAKHALADEKTALIAGLQPLITIGVTSYNAEDTISRALQSVLAQQYMNVEIIVLDDCSTDSSVLKIKQCLEGVPGARLIQQPENRGLSAARNRIIDESRGEFVAFFDDDDESVVTRLEEQLTRIAEYEGRAGTDLVLCHTAREQVFPDATRAYVSTLGVEYGREPQGESVARLMLFGQPIDTPVAPCAGCTLMARRSVYQRIGGFDETLRRSEDTDFTVRFAIAGGAFVGIDKPLVIQQMTYSPDKTLGQEKTGALRWLQNHREYLERIGWYDHSVAWLNMKFAFLERHLVQCCFRLLGLLLCHPVKTVNRIMWSWPNRAYSRGFRDQHARFSRDN
jgi:glycosyltransferase involved in cell wall biosynthesis